MKNKNKSKVSKPDKLSNNQSRHKEIARHQAIKTRKLIIAASAVVAVVVCVAMIIFFNLPKKKSIPLQSTTNNEGITNSNTDSLNGQPTLSNNVATNVQQNQGMPELNPAHGQPGHRCDIEVGSPLNQKPVTSNTKPLEKEPVIIKTDPVIDNKTELNSQTKEVQNNTNESEISFTKQVHDYGTIKKDADGGSEFAFTNTGTEPLILSDVKSSCGCTVPTWPKEPILPGQSEVIKVVYDTKKAGTISKTVTVISNAKNGTVTLSIKGNVTE